MEMVSWQPATSGCRKLATKDEKFAEVKLSVTV